MADNERVISPGKRRARVSTNPSRAEAAYPLKDFLVPVADPQGRSVTLSTTMSPSARRVASIILTKRLFGFQNEQDVWRWCIDNGLKALETRAKDKDVTSETSILNTITAAASLDLEYAHYIKIFDMLEKTIDTLMKRGHLPKAEQLAEKIWKSVDQLEDVYWRKQYRTLAKKKLDEVRAVVRGETGE